MAGRSRTQQALRLVAHGMSPAAAAKEVGISSTAVYRAMERKAGKITCPSCGQVVREGFVLQTKPINLYAELESYIRAGGEKREGARQTLAYLQRVLAEADAVESDSEEAANPFARIIGSPLTDIE